MKHDMYTPDDIKSVNYVGDIGDPAQYPFTRGVHHSGYRGKLWTMLMFAGFGCASVNFYCCQPGKT